MALSKRLIGFSLRLGQFFVSLPQLVVSLRLPIELTPKFLVRLFECGEGGGFAGEGGAAFRERGVGFRERGSALAQCAVGLREGLVRL